MIVDHLVSAITSSV